MQVVCSRTYVMNNAPAGFPHYYVVGCSFANGGSVPNYGDLGKMWIARLRCVIGRKLKQPKALPMSW